VPPLEKILPTPTTTGRVAEATGLLYKDSKDITDHGRRKDFFQGGAKVVKFVFSHSQLKNNLFC